MITPRLEMILTHIHSSSCADIGTDHAYIPIKLSERGVRVIATDIRPGPLEIAEKHVKKHNADVVLRLGAGLSPLSPGETDEIIIAGMGGEMISNIILADMDKAKKSRLILQPMNGQYELRKFLFENGFEIETEDIAKEGFKVYNLIVANAGGPLKMPSELELHLPKSLYAHPLFPKLLEKKKREFSKISDGLKRSADAGNAELLRILDLLNKITLLQEEL